MALKRPVAGKKHPIPRVSVTDYGATLSRASPAHSWSGVTSFTSPFTRTLTGAGAFDASR